MFKYTDYDKITSLIYKPDDILIIDDSQSNG